MERPTWGTVVGILGIIFGCGGLLGSGQTMMMSKMVGFQKQMIQSIETTDLEQNEKQQFESATKMMEEMLSVPPWFGSYAVVVGVLGLIISGTYILASVFLLTVKPLAIPLFYGAAGASVALNAVKIAVAVSTMSFMGIAMSMASCVGFVLDLILLIVVFVSDKSAYKA